jgi:peptide/nickel transport system ATP-binding protein
VSTSDVRTPAPSGNGQAASPDLHGDPVLEIRGLCVDYGAGDSAVHAVVDADLVLRRGQVLGLAGESGSGKSTLAYAATRLLREPGVITAGEVLFRSRAGTSPAGASRPGAAGSAPETADLLDLNEEDLRRVRWSEIAVVMQSALNALNPVIGIGTQIGDVLRAHRPDLGRAGRQRRAVELLEMVGITGDRLGSYPHELSGGMRQRAMIAMALALEPQIVIMDEPTTALDVVTQREILEELIRLRDQLGFAALFITHDLSLLIELADEIAVMYAGRLVERAPALSLFRAPRHPYTYGLLNSFPPMHGERARMTGIPGSPPDLRAVPSGCAFHPRCPHAMNRCPAEVPQLTALTPGPPDGAARREVACWLHDPAAPVPVTRVLALPDPLPGDTVPPGPVPGTPAPPGPAATRATAADEGGTS